MLFKEKAHLNLIYIEEVLIKENANVLEKQIDSLKELLSDLKNKRLIIIEKQIMLQKKQKPTGRRNTFSFNTKNEVMFTKNIIIIILENFRNFTKSCSRI